MTTKKKDQSGGQTKQKTTTLRHWTAQKGLMKGWEIRHTQRMGRQNRSTPCISNHFMQKNHDSKDTNIVRIDKTKFIKRFQSQSFLRATVTSSSLLLRMTTTRHHPTRDFTGSFYMLNRIFVLAQAPQTTPHRHGRIKNLMRPPKGFTLTKRGSNHIQIVHKSHRIVA